MSTLGVGGYLDVVVEFTGGLDSLTIEQTKELGLRIHTPKVSIGQLIAYIRRNIIGAKKDLFAFSPEVSLVSPGNAHSSEDSQEEPGGEAEPGRIKVECVDEKFAGQLNLSESCKIRPGILVLVNDVDWELLGTEGCTVKDKERITFISTLHGG